MLAKLGKLTVVFLLIVIFSIAAYGEFRVDISPESQSIHLNESAEFRLTVIQNLDKVYFFEIYSPDVGWDISTNPAMDRILDAKPGTARSTVLRVRPLYVKPGYYAVPINIKRSGTNDVVKQNVLISVMPEEDIQGEYTPAVRTEVTLPEKIDPRSDIPIKITLKNQNRRNIEKLDVKIRSDFINKDYTTSLKPLETKTLDVNARLDPATEPKEDFLKVTVFATAGGRTVQFDVPMIKYKILPIGDIDRNEDMQNGLLITEKTITLKNNGNIKKDFEYEEKANFFSRLFIKTEPGAVIKEKDGAGYLYWNIPLEPNQEVTITIRTNYNMLLLLLIVVALVIFGYYSLRSPIILTKAAMIISTKQGGASELKVMVSAKNRSKTPVEGIRLYDKVPSIAAVEEEFDAGTLKPEKLVHRGTETILKWDINSIDGHGERILSYRIKTKLSVLGELKLPPAQVKFNQYRRERVVSSKVENLFGRFG